MRSLAVVALLIACGDDGAPVDIGLIDAAPDVRGIVTVHVVDKNDAPIAGIEVVFIDNEATQTRTRTDATGAAQAMVYPNASVTALRIDSSLQGYSLTTVQALMPGDDIRLISAPSIVSPAEDAFGQRQIPMPSIDVASATKSGSTATFTTVTAHGLAIGADVIVSGMSPAGYNGTWQVASVPSANTFTANLGAGGLATGGTGVASPATQVSLQYAAASGATGYTVYTACGSLDVGTSTTPTLTLRRVCAGPMTDVVVLARGANMYMQQIDVPTMGTQTLTDTWHSLATVTATLSNPTSHVAQIELDRFVPYGRGTPTVVANGLAAEPTVLNLSSPLARRALMQTHLRCPNGVSGCLSSSTGTAQQTLTQVVDGTQTTYALDIGANLLPWVTASYDPLTTTIDMSLTGTASIDMYEASLRYSRGQVIYTWRVFGPTPQAFKFPTLPSDLPGDPTVRPADAQGAYQVMLCETDAVAGYRAAIKDVYSTLSRCEASPSITTLQIPSMLSRLSQWN